MGDLISALPAASEAIAGGDLVPVTNVSQPGSGETQKFTQDQLLASVLKLNFRTATELTLAADAITITQGNHKLQPQTGVADDLSTISGLAAGGVCVLYMSDPGTDTLTIKHGTGNISCSGAADITFSQGALICYSNGTTVFVSGGGGATVTKATAAELDTGTDDAKFATALAIAGRSELTGWTPARQTWTYASATTITVPSGAASIYSVGDKIRLKQGAGYKYFYVITVADTVLTVTGGSDYTVATPTAITDNYYSKVSSPVGFPQTFNLGITWTVATFDDSSGGQPTTTYSKFSIVGNLFQHIFRATGTKAGTNATINFAPTQTVPAPPNTLFMILGTGFIIDPGYWVASITCYADTTRTITTYGGGNINDNTALPNGVSGNYSYYF